MKCCDCYDCYWHYRNTRCDGYAPTGPGGICVHWRHKDYPYPYTTREQAYKKKNKEEIQLTRKKKEAELSPEEERRLEITKKLNKEQKLFCYHFIVEDKSMKDAYKAAYP